MRVYRHAIAGVVLLVGLLWPAVAAAQMINVLIVADTNDNDVGAGVAVDLKQLKAVFERNVPEQSLNLRTMSGGEVAKQNILDAIRRIRATSRDAVVVFWSGHGAHDQTGHFLRMPDGVRLYRREVVNAIRDCGAGLDALLTSSCNVFEPLQMEPAWAEPAAEAGISPLFQSLFLDSPGLVDINGASEGEYGFAYPSFGTSFFFPLVCYFENNSERRVSWATFVEEMRRDVQDYFEVCFPEGYAGRAGHKQTTHTLRVWHIPPGWPPREGASGRGRSRRFGVQSGGSPRDRADVGCVFPGRLHSDGQRG